MRRFRFRLAPLLRLRAQLERASRRELARATTALHAVEQELQAAVRGRREFAEAAGCGGTAGQLARALEAGLARREGRLILRQRQAVAALETARLDYVRKARELGSLERLEERQRGEWATQSQREEQQEMDEVARLGRESQRLAETFRGASR